MSASRRRRLARRPVAFATSAHRLAPRRAIALLFAAPAAVAGYHATLGVAHIGVPSEAWREVFAVVGAVVVGVTAWARMTVFAAPLLRQGETAGPATRFPQGARQQGVNFAILVVAQVRDRRGR